MTESDFEPYDGPPGPGLALWPAGMPLPSAWFGSETTPQLICDLCDAWVTALWPLSNYPPVEQDEDNAGDTFVCRSCVLGVRPPIRSGSIIDDREAQVR